MNRIPVIDDDQAVINYSVLCAMFPFDSNLRYP